MHSRGLDASWVALSIAVCACGGSSDPTDGGSDAARDASLRRDAYAMHIDVGPPVDSALIDAAPPPVLCGARTYHECAIDEFCDYSGASLCGRADGRGVCQVVPASCAHDDAPVCGCDRVTYPNACEAARASMGVDATGACRFRCEASWCESGHEYCSVVTTSDLHTPTTSTTYACLPLPTGCGAIATCASCFADDPSCAGGPGELTVSQ